MIIVLSTLNARYSHASLGLRYLLANMGELQPQTHIREFVIGTKTSEIVEQLLAVQPRIIGFGVYIWNVEETTASSPCSSAWRRRYASSSAARKCLMSRPGSPSCNWPIT